MTMDTGCWHGAVEMQVAFDGKCPICMASKIERQEEIIAHLSRGLERKDQELQVLRNTKPAESKRVKFYGLWPWVR